MKKILFLLTLLALPLFAHGVAVFTNESVQGLYIIYLIFLNFLLLWLYYSKIQKNIKRFILVVCISLLLLFIIGSQFDSILGLLLYSSPLLVFISTLVLLETKKISINIKRIIIIIVAIVAIVALIANYYSLLDNTIYNILCYLLLTNMYISIVSLKT